MGNPKETKTKNTNYPLLGFNDINNNNFFAAPILFPEETKIIYTEMVKNAERFRKYPFSKEELIAKKKLCNDPIYYVLYLNTDKMSIGFSIVPKQYLYRFPSGSILGEVLDFCVNTIVKPAIQYRVKILGQFMPLWVLKPSKDELRLIAYRISKVELNGPLPQK